ncbi:L-serine dehydratase [Parafrankia irregularis]|uniref:L-serine dehydratase n=1 Tax=Parafrankia irregularis TaxID=795642 RepID=A0A0S4QIJ2_9ACTN|nr:MULTISPECIES: L-serine ammonia-lyase [Parafrankia]MBE3204190.1 L-serine ammonia-lyase [Parafrankia sp. CH37]CUU54930.1 L-serine dehydratase [Parafrankia irregularis]
MAISVFELFKVGIGPSSSHTVGPMRAAGMFAEHLAAGGQLLRTVRVLAELFGSLGATGRGHSSDRAVILGLLGHRPETIDPAQVDAEVRAAHANGCLDLLGRHRIGFDPGRDLVLHLHRTLPFHPNGMRFTAFDETGAVCGERVYYSVGGGFVLDEDTIASTDRLTADGTVPPYPITSGDQLLKHCSASGLPISEIMLANETVWRTPEDVRSGLLAIWDVMQRCIVSGLSTEGTLPGRLGVPRRAPGLHRRLTAEELTAEELAAAEPSVAVRGSAEPRVVEPGSAEPGGATRGGAPLDPLHVIDRVSLAALAVNEENAAGGRVVTAPTNGAAGIIPAVLHYLSRFVPGSTDDDVVRFLLTAGAIGLLYKENASISGAEVGCQGEVGVACSMAAAGLCEVLGGTPQQVENAAEIGMEHNLGLTCDPVEGLVQVPCIERNAMGAVKAINAARLALHGSGEHIVSLDKVIRTMRETGADMKDKYKETSRGGLAVNFIEC